MRVRHVNADERGHYVGHVGEDDREIGWRAVHDAPQVHAVITQVCRHRAAGPASAVTASRGRSAANRRGMQRGGHVQMP
jgi:hypothetical protein